MATQKEIKETIIAPVTPPGRGGVGIVRVSGPLVKTVIQKVIRRKLTPRHAYHLPFLSENDEVLDEGLAIFFENPYSFTGEDVLELQGHGGPVVLDRIIKTIIKLGARFAKPGEFSERAFLNDKIDLAQAEAIADLINASSEEAAQSAIRSLQGEFSQKIQTLVQATIELRIYVEAAIDFPEEEIDFLSDGKVEKDLENIISQLSLVQSSAKQGVLLSEGMTAVIMGEPNVGKSSLLNCLSERESAIVTNIPGTTRDVLREYIQLDGLPLHIIDTAGLRDSDDVVEQEGIRRAKKAMEEADVVLLMQAAHHPGDLSAIALATLEDRDPGCIKNKPTITIQNKIDINNEAPRQEGNTIYLSAKTGEGIDLLKQALKKLAGFHEGEGIFTARRRHLDALSKAHDYLKTGQQQLANQKAGELLAEDLRQAQEALSEITGEFTPDDLLGKIFSSFCIGK